MLEGAAPQAEMEGRRKHVAVVGLHFAFSDLLRRRKMNSVHRAYEKVVGS